MKEENKDILIPLLEKVLELKISEIKYLNSERNVDNIHVKRKHFDLNLKTDRGYVQVEVNAIDNDYVKPRNAAYICDTYSHVTEVGKTYSEDVMIIQINFSYGLSDDKLYRVYKIQDSNGENYVKNFVIYEFNMDLYHEFWDNNNEKEIEENKLLIMLDLELNDLKKLSTKDKVVKKYMEELDRVNQDPEFREYMSAEEDNRKIENSLRVQWKKEGLAEGKVEGIKEGINQKKLQVAKNMLKEQLDINLIARVTGLTVKEIKDLD